MFTFYFCGEQWIFSMAVNVVHESMFSYFWVTMLKEKDLFQSLW